MVHSLDMIYLHTPTFMLLSWLQDVELCMGKILLSQVKSSDVRKNIPNSFCLLDASNVSELYKANYLFCINDVSAFLKLQKKNIDEIVFKIMIKIHVLPAVLLTKMVAFTVNCLLKTR